MSVCIILCRMMSIEMCADPRHLLITLWNCTSLFYSSILLVSLDSFIHRLISPAL